MPNPFPGIDPYVEAQLNWASLHTRFLTYLCDALARQLPARYAAEIEERLTLVTYPGGVGERVGDVVVTVDPLRTSPRITPAASRMGLMEPTSVPLATTLVEAESVERWIEIRRQPGRSLVAVIELLSPSNKVEPGRSEYGKKRLELIRQSVHLIEIDFLIGGRRLPMPGPLPPGDYYAFVARSERRPDCDVYGGSVRGPIPTIPLPLDPPDPDLPLDLASTYAAAYENGRCALNVRPDEPLGLPLAPDDRAWVEATARAASPR